MDISNLSPLELIDLERYPITQMSSPSGVKMIADCHQQIKKNGSCVLPGFLKKEVIDEIAKECDTLSHLAYHNIESYNNYDPKGDLDFPNNHPRNRWFYSSNNLLAYNYIPQEFKLYKLYHCDIFAEFIASILQMKKIYCFNDEFQALNISFMQDGDHFNWHYDFNDFIITILLQEPEIGGEFEFVPNIRNEKEQNYPQVEKLFDTGEHTRKETLTLRAGTLTLFQGMNSMHRVKCVYGKKKRIVSILCYHSKENFKTMDEQNAYAYGSRAVEIMEKKDRWYNFGKLRRKVRRYIMDNL
ncbi:hypothetical protein [Candidatus Uabimicrobium sp. HlEnr_7]|uniref:HalD/BesD family halogenase n=1 Tax=Candidatus Uabimicrobium helgolandensis TaxID=3095367 RepID=UPI00355676A8